MRSSIVSAALAAALSLAACGGGSSGDLATDPSYFIAPEAGYSRGSRTYGAIGAEGRYDYYAAMDDDCVKDNGYPSCSRDGDGWFIPWDDIPKVYRAKSSTPEEKWVIWRAIQIVNRSLPDDRKLKLYLTDRSLARFDPYDDHDVLKRRLSDGAIHTEIYPYDDPDSGGIAWTDGERAYALLDETDFVLDSEEDDFRWDVRSAVDTMVHEVLHALGLSGHPHPIHTSILSYRHHREGELDNVPLVDAAVLYDMYNFGHWAEDIDFVVDTVDGVQFGVYGLYDEDDEENFSALIPWVDAGYMAAPESDALLGSASYQGELAGIITSSGHYADGDVAIKVNFDNDSGTARFDQIHAYDGTSWSMWERRGWTYDLHLYAHYFASTGVIATSDVVGAFYGWDAEVVAGTLQRPEITAAFGAEKD